MTTAEYNPAPSTPPKTQQSTVEDTNLEDQGETIELTMEQYEELLKTPRPTHTVRFNTGSLKGYQPHNKGKYPLTTRPDWEPHKDAPEDQQKNNSERHSTRNTEEMAQSTTSDQLQTFRRFSFWSGVSSLALLIALGSLTAANIVPLPIFAFAGIMLIAAGGIFLTLWNAFNN